MKTVRKRKTEKVNYNIFIINKLLRWFLWKIDSFTPVFPYEDNFCMTGIKHWKISYYFNSGFYTDFYSNWLLDTFIYIWCADVVLNTRMFLKSAWICVLLEECIISNNQRKMGEICKPGLCEWGRTWFPFLVSFRYNMTVSWWTPLLVKLEFFLYLVIVSNCYLFCYFPSQYS